MILSPLKIASGENLYGYPMANNAVKLTVWNQA